MNVEVFERAKYMPSIVSSVCAISSIFHNLKGKFEIGDRYLIECSQILPRFLCWNPENLWLREAGSWISDSNLLPEMRTCDMYEI